MPKRSLDRDADDERPRRRSRRDDDDDDEEEEEEERPPKPTRRKRRRPPPKGGFPVAVVLLIGGGVVLLIAGVVALLPFLNRNGGVPGPNANGVVNNNPLGLPGVGPPAVVRPPLPPGWVDFKHPECNLSIHCPQYPGPVEFYSSERLGSPIVGNTNILKSHKSTYYTRGEKSVWCFVGVSEYPPTFSQHARDTALRHTLFIDSPTTREVLWNGKAAFEVSGGESSPKGARVVTRRFWAGNRLYSASLHGVDGHPNEAELAAFFGSFVLGE